MSNENIASNTSVLKFLVPSMKDIFQFGSIGRTKVDVIGGQLAGASLEVNGSFSCGSNVDCDVVLISPKIADVHFKAESKNPWSRKVRLVATGDTIKAAGKRVERGQWVETSLPATVELPGIQIKLDQTINLSGFTRRASLVAATLVSLVGLIWAGSTISDAVIVRPIASAISQPKVTPQVPKQVVADASTNLTAVKAKLEELNLLAQIEVASTSTGNIQLTGELGTLEVEQWREFLKWYDAGKNPPMLNNVKRSTKATALPRIAAVSYGKSSRIFLADGGEVKVGESFGPNLTVQSIGQDSILMSRGAETIKLKLRL